MEFMEAMVKAICGVQKYKIRSKDLMLMLGAIETIDQLAMANSFHWCSCVLRREDGYVLRRALDIEVEDQRKKSRLKRTWKKYYPQVYTPAVFILPSQTTS